MDTPNGNPAGGPEDTLDTVSPPGGPGTIERISLKNRDPPIRPNARLLVYSHPTITISVSRMFSILITNRNRIAIALHIQAGMRSLRIQRLEIEGNPPH